MTDTFSDFFEEASIQTYIYKSTLPTRGTPCCPSVVNVSFFRVAESHILLNYMLDKISLGRGCQEMLNYLIRNVASLPNSKLGLIAMEIAEEALTHDPYMQIYDLRGTRGYDVAVESTIVNILRLLTQCKLVHCDLHLGNAFQLIDDALDYCSDAKTIGKNIGDDLAGGKVTLPLLYALQKSTPEQQQKIRLSITQGGRENLPQILEALAATDAITFTKDRAREEVDQAISALAVLPASAYKDALAGIAHYAIEREH
jgi:hypothetical protein